VLDGIECRESSHGDGGLGLFATRPFKENEPIGFLPRHCILDPIAVLRDDPIAVAATRVGATPNFAFWFSLAAAAKDEAHFHHPYLAALPCEAPDPCSWSDENRALLDGTPMGKQVHRQRQLLKSEYDRVAPRLQPGVERQSKYVSFDDVLWARGVHLSRCFPRPLVDAAQQDLMHEVLASTEVDAPLRVVHGGSGPPKVIWAAPGALGSAHVSAATSASAPKAVTDSLETKAEDKPEDTLGSAEATHQNVGEGASGDVSGAGAGGADEADEVDAQVSRALQLEHEDETAAGNLGCMLPLFDMFEHKCGHPIVWEAGRGGVRFRCRAPVPKGAPLHNNYGAKGNEELLFTYGFAVRGNPLDAVEGVVVGCAPTPDTALAAERRRLLEEHGVPYTTREADGALLIGPFELHVTADGKGGKGGKGEEGEEGEESEEGEEGEEAASGGGALPAELFLALSVIGMDDPSEGPSLTPDELDLLVGTLQARLQPLLPTEAADDAAADEQSCAGYVAAYRDGQRRVLRAALAQVAQMGAGDEANDADDE